MRLAAVTMQKDEVGLLRQWISYYANLTGYENLYIFDDCSNSAEVIEILRNAERLGVNIFWNSEKSWSVDTKGIMVGNLINKLSSHYDWFFPVDCDEFICVKGTGSQPLFSRDDVVREIRRASVGGHKILRIKARFINIPHTECVFHGETRKVALQSGGKPLKLDIGYHLYNYRINRDTVDENRITDSNLALLDFHYRPFSVALKCAREKLKFRVPDFEEGRMRNYSGAGLHLAYLFYVSEEEYYSMFSGKEALSVRHIFDSLGLPVPYSEPRRPLQPDELQVLRNPRNLEREKHLSIIDEPVTRYTSYTGNSAIIVLLLAAAISMLFLLGGSIRLLIKTVAPE